ncbi:MAG: biotin-dependent carboxyltransferase family protein [Acetobacteraceae bacterium]|nr:biotin-dependent carboxyltransferase family protein [Acetobacteraceae bacterium]
MIEVIATSGLASVQDLGRYGSLRYGVGRAGAMDRLALAAANILAGNDEGAAGLELQAFPFRARFTADCGFAITGVDCAARLDDQALLPWSAYRARAGQELVLGLPQGTFWRASRAYLALPGGVDVPEVLGSRSTQLRGAFGGIEGRFLEIGDHLRAADPGDIPAGFGLVPPSLALPLEADGVPAVRVLPAGEYCCFTPATKDAFWSQEWKITAQSDRYGYRLAGLALEFAQPVEMLSHGIVPGVIQVPSGGQPIIQMSDAQPSGGYPKIGTVIDADLWRLGQAPIGSRIRFVQTTWNEAVAADEEVRAWLAEAARLTRLWRAQLQRGRP